MTIATSVSDGRGRPLPGEPDLGGHKYGLYGVPHLRAKCYGL